ncbi:MAG: dTDP-glucose 4,6-dehydratase [Flavobacteriales bacterium]|nr:dTDP-glucose 4,6-dehydratase [Flavobacteriales bacterium]
MRFFSNILITGGAGFIGSHVIRQILNHHPVVKVVNLDLLTYAGNLENLADIELNFQSSGRYTFVKGDICDKRLLKELFSTYQFDAVIHLAAESHVDRSIENPQAFLETNILGTAALLDAAKHSWLDNDSNHTKDKMFYHISTDEVYGSLGNEGLFSEETSYDPRSPYSASKASSDHIVRAYCHTYRLPVVISNCSNNYGANQFPEKLIPLMIKNIKDNIPLPIYGKGLNIRDWLFVEDHAKAIDLILHKGEVGDTYNIGGLNEWSNIDLVKHLIKLTDKKLNRPQGTSNSLIQFVTDRAGHDKRYAIDASKIDNKLGWAPSVKFEEGLEKTVDWYLCNTKWLDNIASRKLTGDVSLNEKC